MKVVILGGGLAGLSAAHQLTQDGVRVVVLEAEAEVGGLARSPRRDGFTFDLGPHRFHTKDRGILAHASGLLGGDLVERARKSRILLEGSFFDYPLRIGNAVFTMPPLTTARIILDYLQAKTMNLVNPKQDANFEDWVVRRFGRRLYELYFKVYTEKTWGIPCTQLSVDWAAQRISLLSLWDTLVKTLKKGGDTPRTYASRFHYPQKGGIGRISEEYRMGITGGGGEVRLESRVREVRLAGDRIANVVFEGGSVEIGQEDLVFSTIPLTDLIFSFRPKPPPDVMEAASELRFRSIVFLHLMFRGERVSDDNWIYLPEPKYVCNRVSEPKNFSGENAPEGKTAICAEITCQKGDRIWVAGKEELATRALDDLASIGLVDKGEYMGCELTRVEHAYPIYDLDYRRNLDIVLGHLRTIPNLRFFGRNGLFRYNNMDHSIGMGLTAGKSVTDRNTDYLRIATEEHWFG